MASAKTSSDQGDAAEQLEQSMQISQGRLSTLGTSPRPSTHPTPAGADIGARKSNRREA